jgi:hypothetical protein
MGRGHRRWRPPMPLASRVPSALKEGGGREEGAVCPMDRLTEPVIGGHGASGHSQPSGRVASGIGGIRQER